jgi:anti-sigma factor ChrR (cupin superfamily)
MMMPAEDPKEHQPLVLHDLMERDFDDSDHDWQAFRDGVDIIPLHGDRSEGCSSALLRYQPGATVPMHAHSGHEHLLILKGSQTDGKAIYRRGTFIINTPGSHHRVSSEEGCVVLAIWESPIRFIEE